jgi:hypothetical protein
MIYRILGFFLAFSILPTSLLGQGTPAILSSPSAVQGVINVCISNPVVSFSDTTNLAGFLQTWTFQNGTPATATGPGPHNVTFSDTGYVVLTVLDSATNQTTTDSVLVQVNTSFPTLTLGLNSLQNQSLVTSSFNGSTFFRSCGSGPFPPVRLTKQTTGANNSSTYQINWGDGSAPAQILGSNWGVNGLQKSFSNPGFYTITVTVTLTNGCSATTSIGYFQGSTPAGGIVNPGNAALCLPDSLALPISGTSGNTPGTSYTITVSDSSSPTTFIHPNIGSSFVHYFQFPSCGYTVGQYPNAFKIDMTIANPCGSALSTASPIYVSEKNKIGFQIFPDTLVCQNQTITVVDTSVFGKNSSSPSCDSLVIRLWGITPNSYTLAAGDTIGDSSGVGLWPTLWTSGSDSLEITFTQPGNYLIKLINANACSQIDTLVKQICILPLATATFQVSDTLACVPASISIDNQTTTAVCGIDSWLWRVQHSDSLNCGSNSWSFSNNTDSLSFEPEFNFAGAGVYTITLISNYPLSQLDTLRCPADTTVHTVQMQIRRLLIAYLVQSMFAIPTQRLSLHFIHLATTPFPFNAIGFQLLARPIPWLKIPLP